MASWSSSSDSVTVDRVYFDALLRRANFNTKPVSQTVSADPLEDLPVLVPQDEYDALCRAAQQYANLRQNLLLGGVDESTVAPAFLWRTMRAKVLCADNAESQTTSPMLSKQASLPDTTDKPDDGHDGYDSYNASPGFTAWHAPAAQGRGGWHSGLRQPPGRGTGKNGETDYAGGPSASGYSGYTEAYGHRNGNGDGSGNTVYGSDGEVDRDGSGGGDGVVQGAYDSHRQAPWAQKGLTMRGVPPMLDGTCRRTVQITRIPEDATHADVVAAVRGGPLLDLYLRPYDRVPMVSFVHEAGACAFLDHVRQHGLHIKNRRMQARWADRHSHMAGHIKNKIAAGASRNLVLRQHGPRITEEQVREDLDHIHNLVVISVTFADGDCYISTNSVHNAMFARTCMMSRAMYRHSRIDWAPDECAQPFESPSPVLRSAQARPEKAQARPERAQARPVNAKPRSFAAPNRFELLNMDSEESGEAGDADDVTRDDEDDATD